VPAGISIFSGRHGSRDKEQHHPPLESWGAVFIDAGERNPEIEYSLPFLDCQFFSFAY
jgi:hypothetical protein